MSKQRNDPKPKPIDEWGTTEWEIAYNKLNEKYEKLKNHMRLALNLLNKAQTHLSEAIV